MFLVWRWGKLLEISLVDLHSQTIAHDEKTYYTHRMEHMDNSKYMPYISTKYIYCDYLCNISGAHGGMC